MKFVGLLLLLLLAVGGSVKATSVGGLYRDHAAKDEVEARIETHSPG